MLSTLLLSHELLLLGDNAVFILDGEHQRETDEKRAGCDDPHDIAEEPTAKEGILTESAEAVCDRPTSRWRNDIFERSDPVEDGLLPN